MKKIISVLLVITAVTMLFVSCAGSGLSGTYRCDDKYPQIDGEIYKINFDGDKCVDMEYLIGKLRTANF